jgi:hypothetical protein
MNLKQEYENACHASSDINEHLPKLYEMAKLCNHITEMGVRSGDSTKAFLYADPKKYVAYDLNIDQNVNNLFEYCKTNGKDYEYIQADVLKIKITKTDLLFIDTYHCYEQLSQELTLHASKVRKYIVFHDTVSYGRVGENLDFQNFSGTKGIMYAIEEFLEQNSDWEIIYDANNNNGLMVIERK